MSALLPCVEVEPARPAQSAVVFLHGLGADGHDFEPIVPYLKLGQELRTRFLFPHAPARAVTLNMGMVMPAWYDIRQVDLRHEHDDRGVAESTQQVRDLIARERQRGIPSERIVLGGFSQGGALALHVALRHPEVLAGILALSTYLLFEDSVGTERREENRKTPIFLAHGLHDPMVPLDRGEAARDRLRGLGHEVLWKTYPMAHEVHPEEVRDMGAWLGERLAAPS